MTNMDNREFCKSLLSLPKTKTRLYKLMGMMMLK
jgi:hypothetical protein